MLPRWRSWVKATWRLISRILTSKQNFAFGETVNLANVILNLVNVMINITKLRSQKILHRKYDEFNTSSFLNFINRWTSAGLKFRNFPRSKWSSPNLISAGVRLCVRQVKLSSPAYFFAKLFAKSPWPSVFWLLQCGSKVRICYESTLGARAF